MRNRLRPVNFAKSWKFKISKNQVSEIYETSEKRNSWETSKTARAPPKNAIFLGIFWVRQTGRRGNATMTLCPGKPPKATAARTPFQKGHQNQNVLKNVRKFLHGPLHTPNDHIPLKPLYFLRENDVDKLLTITSTNCWQRNRKNRVNLLTPKHICICYTVRPLSTLTPKTELVHYPPLPRPFQEKHQK